MDLDRFLRIAQLLGNTTWVRTYLASFPGHLVLVVLEIANVDASDLSMLRAELSGVGFHEMTATTPCSTQVVRFAVERG